MTAAVEFYRSREPKLLRTISIRAIFVTCMGCPVVALLHSFILGSMFHSSELFNYRWTCGIVHLPSISRIMNMPLQRILFQTLILSSVPLRFLLLLKQWLDYSNVNVSRKFALARTLMVLCGVADTLFLSLLSVIGERESGDIHVMLFSGFAITSYVYFICLSLLTRWTFDGSESEALRAKLQLTLLMIVTLTILLIIVFFILYNGFCVPFTYELFALFEYLTVIAICSFHACSFTKMTGHLYVVHNSIKSPTQRL